MTHEDAHVPNGIDWGGHADEHGTPFEPSGDDAEWVDARAAVQLTEQISEAHDRQDEPVVEAGRRIVLHSAANMTPRRIKWLNGDVKGGRIPLGGITLLAGREGIGKSTITYDLIAQVTKGELPGEYFDTPKGAVVYATEDEWEPVIVPRLIAAGADRKYVHRAEAYTADGEKDAIDFPLDLKRLAAQCVKNDVALVVLDPIMSVINGKLDTHKDREVRQALDPLTSFAGAAGVAVIGLIHVNKSGGNDPLNSVMGSRAFSAVARSVLFCVKVEGDGDDENAQPTYLFTHEKCNLGPKMPSKQYEIKAVELSIEDVDGSTFAVWTSKVEWGFYDRRGAREVMEGNEGGNRVKAGSLKEKILKILKGREMVPLRLILTEMEEGGTSPGTTKVTLTRMVKAGEILNKPKGFYQPVTIDYLLDDDVNDG
jgi:hypothetical protein